MGWKKRISKKCSRVWSECFTFVKFQKAASSECKKNHTVYRELRRKTSQIITVKIHNLNSCEIKVWKNSLHCTGTCIPVVMCLNLIQAWILFQILISQLLINITAIWLWWSIMYVYLQQSCWRFSLFSSLVSLIMHDVVRRNQVLIAYQGTAGKL